jgi:1,2-diacylglycerol 3-beta-glucosyltransferase
MHVVDITWFSYLTFAVVIYYLILFVHPLYKSRRRQRDRFVPGNPFMVLVIPAHNEEQVIAPTLEALTALEYPDRLIIVMNDGSKDKTSEIARTFESRGVLVVDRDEDVAGQGKGAVLNHAFEIIGAMIAANDPALCGRDAAELVIGIMDADGQLEADTLTKVAPYFADPSVGGVQIGVRIANAPTNMLTRMQDMEFVGFSALVQEARDVFGSVGLGGNGQFTRMTALQSLDRPPWTDCLTEDLELSLSLAEVGWRIRYCPGTYVAQQGLTHWRPLLRQRTRWFQGHYQCWRHLPSLWRSKKLPWYTKLDLSIYLVMVTFVMVVFAGVLVSLTVTIANLPVENNSLVFVTDPRLRNLIQLTLSFGPLIALVWTYQKHSFHRLALWELPAFAVAFSLYVYLFVASQFWAWARMASGRGSWAKTPRVTAESVV